VKVLVDTHAFLWFMAGDARLSRAARRAIEASDGAWWLSAASVWELAIKSSLGRLTLPAPAAEYIADKVQNGLRVLAIEWPHAAAVERLPLHHRDPFDRLIVTQAQSDRLTIVTKDAVFRKYGVSVAW
jgi:PIN domain nuclease of toxin-antitoxin system